jgi:hypothetical protein
LLHLGHLLVEQATAARLPLAQGIRGIEGQAATAEEDAAHFAVGSAELGIVYDIGSQLLEVAGQQPNSREFALYCFDFVPVAPVEIDPG